MDDLTVSVGTVVVFYRPDDDCVHRANRLTRIGPCVVVDNTEDTCRTNVDGLNPEVIYVPNGQNVGIAKAINQGVERLIEKGCSSALIFDQDSDPSVSLLDALPVALEAERRRNPKIALIGPAYVDERLGGGVPFVRFGYIKLYRVPLKGVDPVEVDFLITSGSCINLVNWKDVGPMDETLFIDFVDLEWCIRARHKGYSVLGMPALRLAHALGGEPVRICGRNYPGHSAVRHYYMFRNAIALIRRSYVPWSWKSTELVKMPFRLAIYGMFMAHGMEHLRLSALGIWHGIRGRSGSLEEARRY